MAFLVRLKHSKALHGLFVERKIRDLFRTIDASMDPYEFEIMELHRGGLLFEEPPTYDWDLQHPDDLSQAERDGLRDGEYERMVEAYFKDPEYGSVFATMELDGAVASSRPQGDGESLWKSFAAREAYR